MLAGIARALRPDGVFLMVDIRASSNLEDNIDSPFGPFLYTVSTMHCMTVSLAQGGAGLGTVWGEQRAEQMLRDAGFGSIEVDARRRGSAQHLLRRPPELTRAGLGQPKAAMPVISRPRISACIVSVPSTVATTSMSPRCRATL